MTTEGAVADLFDGIHVVDADTHLTEARIVPAPPTTRGFDA
ncbi:MAG TPA: hypothetical protein VFC99_00740 [Acidimicrobiia bacterium]|nr:hypothetical protein [Acidimicrobiia bacterium]